MAATALIKFTQNLTTDAAGRALVGDTANAVVVSNGDNSDVSTWKYELLDVPPGSAVSLATQGPGLLTTFTFGPPDVPGSYRVRLTVVGTSGETDVDIRVFAVPFPQFQLLAPPYQANPPPLPLAGAGAKPDEMNFSGSARGWSGDPAQVHKLLYDALSALNTLNGANGRVNVPGGGPATLVRGTNVASVTRIGLGFVNVVFTRPMPDDLYRVLVTPYNNDNITAPIAVLSTGFTAIIEDDAGSAVDGDFCFIVMP
jgi:hypothetical protein